MLSWIKKMRKVSIRSSSSQGKDGFFKGGGTGVTLCHTQDAIQG